MAKLQETQGKKSKGLQSVTEKIATKVGISAPIVQDQAKQIDPANWQAFKEQKAKIQSQMLEIKQLKAQKFVDPQNWQSFKDQKEKIQQQQEEIKALKEQL